MRLAQARIDDTVVGVNFDIVLPNRCMEKAPVCAVERIAYPAEKQDILATQCEDAPPKTRSTEGEAFYPNGNLEGCTGTQQKKSSISPISSVDICRSWS